MTNTFLNPFVVSASNHGRIDNSSLSARPLRRSSGQASSSSGRTAIFLGALSTWFGSRSAITHRKHILLNYPVLTVCLLALLLLRTVTAEPLLSEVGIQTAAGGSQVFQLEVAATEEARQRGLMFRSDLADDGGMLFQYEQPRLASIWMKNTPIPLDILFVREDGIILNIEADTTPYSLTPMYAAAPVLAVIELKGGTCDRLGIRAGDRVIHPLFGTTSDFSTPRQSPSSTAAPPPADAHHR